MAKSLHSLAKYWAIIPAAGVSSRMAHDLPKQYLKIADKTIIEHALKNFLAHDSIFKIVVVLNKNDQHWQNLPISTSSKIITAVGGEQRSDSVLAGLNSITKLADAEDWVLVHDAARPCLTRQDLNKLLEELHEHSVGGLLGIPARDTLKKVIDDHQVIATIDRHEIWQAQTPQMFRYGLLLRALQDAKAKHVTVTDDASAIELLGLQPKIVLGQFSNLKVTTREDLKLAQFILSQEKE